MLNSGESYKFVQIHTYSYLVTEASQQENEKDLFPSMTKKEVQPSPATMNSRA